VSRRKAKDTAAPEDLSLLAFGASWCGPWQLLQPIFARIEADGTAIRRVDVDTDEATAERFRVISLPTIVVLRGGDERRRVMGAISESELKGLLARRR
jgi:thioredoxin 1